MRAQAVVKPEIIAPGWGGEGRRGNQKRQERFWGPKMWVSNQDARRAEGTPRARFLPN